MDRRTLGYISALLLAALFAVVLAACGNDDEDGGGGDDEADAGAILQAAVERFEALSSFAFRLTHENGTTPIVQGLAMREAEGDVEEPDRLRADIDVTGPGGAFLEVSVVSIGDDFWLTNFFTREFEQVEGINVAEVFDPATGVPSVADSLQNPRVVGQERVDGEDCHIVEGTVDSGNLQGIASFADPGNEVTVRVWIGRESELIRRVVVAGPLAEGEDPEIARTISVSSFDEEFGIEPPD